MPAPDLIQQQRQLLREFRQIVAGRADEGRCQRIMGTD